MQVETLTIPELPDKHGDQRGFFSETFRANIFEAHAVGASFVQDNHVRSTQKGVLRGLHYQTPLCAKPQLSTTISRSATARVPRSISCNHHRSKKQSPIFTPTS